MTQASTQTRPEYQLAVEPDGTSWVVRENLANMLERELLGPARGETEEIENPPDATYLIGRIAPVKLQRSGAAPAGADDDSATDVDELDAEQSRGVPVDSVDESTAESDEDNVDDQPQKRGLMIPASMGLRFQIPLDLERFTVIASWGTYEPFDTGRVSKAGSKIRHFRRTPIDRPVTIAVADLDPTATSTFPLHEDVALRVDLYPDHELGRYLVEVALCNDRVTPRKIPVNAWLFQTKLYVEAGGSEVFLPVRDVLVDDSPEHDEELRRLDLQYRDRLEFAIGRTCSADWAVAPNARRASKVWTTWLPVAETAQTRAQEISDATLDMRVLAQADAAALEAGLRPIVDGYAQWLEQTAANAATLPEHLREIADGALTDARKVLAQLTDGLDFLVSDAEAQRCFRFMNRVMADQRVQTQIAEKRAKQPKLGRDEARDQVLRGDHPHSWRTFQLAFVLMQIRGLTEPAHARRSGKTAKVELLFFPTGGGKTEAYLGLAAYAFAIRRRQGVIDTPDGKLDGRTGVTVLMRYTLRLLTAQQFQRATALVCAAELARREDENIWGAEPFRIGLWVGTDVSPKRYDEAAEQLQKVHDGRSHRLTVLQIRRCPWCGTRINPADVQAVASERRVYVYCGDPLTECPFSMGGSADKGLPVLTVDEEIYRLTPAFVIATVDKFARLAREGEAAALFGYVRARCERHGFVHVDYRHCEIDIDSRHNKSGDLRSAYKRVVPRLRPPDLIIQDELHLITGALGTTVGLFEAAIEVITTWRDPDGTTVKPMIVASTATVRNAHEQIRNLYGRAVTVFPPQVLDVSDTFFAKEVPVSRKNPGRRYLGVSTTGVRLTNAEIQVASNLMTAAQLLLDRAGVAADPYLTLVGYFNATRELAGMSRFMQDDVPTRLDKVPPWSGLPRRRGTDYGALNVGELTSRVSSANITGTLDDMAVPFDPDFDSTDGRRRLAQLAEEKKPLPKREVNPYDVILATSMLQVGVDVTRLGLMLIVGQPKNTAEYIQASSRVGRDAARPGLVVTLGNWARPRDLAHFEQFRHYHDTFYKRVEALSVTPYSLTSLTRGLDGVLVSAARVLAAHRSDGLSPEHSAWRVDDQRAALDEIVDRLVERATFASDEHDAKRAADRLNNRVEQWSKRRALMQQQNKSLVYERVRDEANFSALMDSAENAAEFTGDGAPFVVANSMREVQPEINLLVSPIPEKLFMFEPPGSPQWAMPSGEDSR